MVAIKTEYMANNIERARELQIMAARLRLLFGTQPGLPVRKMGLTLRGFDCHYVNAPMRQMTKAEVENFSEAIKSLENEFSFPLTNAISN